MLNNPRAVVAVLLCLIVLTFVVASAVITLKGGNINDQGLAFWQQWLAMITGGLIGYIAGNSEAAK